MPMKHDSSFVLAMATTTLHNALRITLNLSFLFPVTCRRINLLTCFSMLCASCLELTTENCSQYSDSGAVFKSRLKTFLFAQAFSSFSAH